MVGLRRRHLIAQSPKGDQALSATATLNPSDHANRWINLGGDGSTLQTYTLPAATGSGDVYKFRVTITNTGTYTINCAGSDEFAGTITGTDESGEDEGQGWLALPGDNFVQITTGTVAQGQIGSFIEVHDGVAATWSASGFVAQSGGSEVTPFST